MKRIGNIYPILISDENLKMAIEEVNRTHRWRPRQPSGWDGSYGAVTESGGKAR